MVPLEIRLFGAPTLVIDQTPQPLGRRKALAMLAYLAVTGLSQRREMLLTLLWSEHDPTKALTTGTCRRSFCCQPTSMEV